jgi:ABC-type glycerol-3-phosphate transport system substrate-binding protein
MTVKPRRRAAAALLLCLLAGAAAAAQADAAGEWTVSFATPSGPAEFTMYVNQEGTRLTGRLTSDAGEFPLRGIVDGDSVTITWTLPDAGRLLAVTFSAKITGDELRGTATLGDRGQGPLSGERVGR